MKIAVIGCGKRFKDVYYKILKRMKCEIFLWNRTQEKSQQFCGENNCNRISDLSEIEIIKPDLIICFVPPAAQFEIISKISYRAAPFLLETPALDNKIFSFDGKVGVLEQWPKLPLEQFKEMLYKTKFMSRPYMVMNDGRSFDYHAISQLRTYTCLPDPVIIKGSMRSFENSGVFDKNSKLNTDSHDWTLGQIEMSNNSILLYNFAYNCKNLLSIPVQFLRAVSTDGSILTGRMKEIGNDYEIIDVRIVDNDTKIVEICQVEVDRKDNVTRSIGVKDRKWVNPFADLDFDDQQTAIASLIMDSVDNRFYSYKDAFVDQVCINAIKNSALTHQTFRLK